MRMDVSMADLYTEKGVYKVQITGVFFLFYVFFMHIHKGNIFSQIVCQLKSLIQQRQADIN